MRPAERCRRACDERGPGLRDAIKEAERIGLVREMDRAHAYWSVFESNRIEFEGPDLSGTVEAKRLDHSHSLPRQAPEVAARSGLHGLRPRRRQSPRRPVREPRPHTTGVGRIHIEDLPAAGPIRFEAKTWSA
jgi:hypothetical protein